MSEKQRWTPDKLYKNAVEEISSIKLKGIHERYFTILITFSDNLKCELELYSSTCSTRLSCYHKSCRVKKSDAEVITSICRKEFGEEIDKGKRNKKVLLKPDWFSSITKSGKGWEKVVKVKRTKESKCLSLSA